MAVRSEGEVYLPPDFISFIDKNYERILDIREKIKQFHDQSVEKEKKKNKYFLKYGSVDSDQNSESDIKNIISAKVIPKKLRFARLDTIEIGSDYLSQCQRNSEEEDDENLEYISHKFPLVSLSMGSSSSVSSNSVLLVEGRPVQLSDRVINRCIQAKVSATKRLDKKCQVKASQRKGILGRKKKKRVEFAKAGSRMDQENYFPSVNEIAWDIYTRYYNSSTSQLTLPPLHSSVLTLLGQRSPVKPSPRSGVSQGSATSATKNKKLRRHGRRRKSGSRGREDGSKEEKGSFNKDANEGNPDNPTVVASDEPQETQLSIIDVVNELDKTSGGTSKGKQYYSRDNITSLHHILDDFLVRRSWHSTVESVDSEIKALQQSLAKPETKLKPGTINLKEDLWLSFPRTWSHSSGTFSTPKDPQKLKEMSPIEYLQSCVRISEPRQHLYNLVFQRYRAMENPLGKTIRVEVTQRALAEVLGQPLKPQQITELFQTYLDLSSDEQEINESEFRGIAALCERVYGKYSLEDSNECYVCAKYPNKDKNRCHKNQGDLVEQADLEYLSRKIRGNEVEPHLAQLLLAICDRELNFN